MTAIYATDPIVASPNTSYNIINENLSISDAVHKCKDFDAKLPTLYEGISMFYNQHLINVDDSWYISTNSYSNSANWLFSLWTCAIFSVNINNPGYSQYFKILCMKR